jgi:acyl transferase domain-containing protein/NADPH:quinone reductase-like Zn-dependent oxidoreductase/acyl carrier protein
MASPEPIAIVGMSCRLSGDVSNPEDLWTMLSRSRDGWTPIPTDRFSYDAYHHPNPQKKGCFNQKGGYFMRQDLSRFDAPFFQITQQEALAMDPQQRQLLECTYEALENAGLAKESIAGRNMGVFVGAAASDYRIGTLRDVNQVPMFDSTGNHQSIQAGRISYLFDLRGPCFSVDTACSSSLYALHSAVQSIRSGESDSAIVAGCALHIQPDDMVSMSMLGIFNDDGKTFAFDHRAKSGFARGEGVGCLVLKPLKQALADNDKIRSVIVNSGTSQDGKTVGMTTPSGEAQEKLIRDVYARANISPEQTGFVEAHGTGTKVGDPIEAGAVHRVFGKGRTKRAPLYMGSVKTNIGHLENASGIISVIKASLMLEKGFILPNVNFEKPNEAIPLDEWNIKVPVKIRPWPKDKRYISVNNFGFGGSNAHVVLEAPPWSLNDLPQEARTESPKLIVLSAYDEAATKRLAAQIGVYIEQHPEIFQKRLLGDMAYTLDERRSHLPWRIAVTASTCDELSLAINSASTIPKRATGVPKLAFAYTGQGAQWPQMGRELLQTHTLFAETLRDAADCLRRLGADFDLVEEISKPKEESNVAKAHISQPVCTAVQLGLTNLLLSWGVSPSMVVGHSSGEIAAAFAAGAITLEDAMAVAYYRGQVATSIKTKYPDVRGAMLAVGAGPAEVKKTIKLLGLTGLGVACENSPNSVTVSGDDEAIDALAAAFESQNMFQRKLRVDVAYHSAHMELVAKDYMDVIQHVPSRPLKEGVTFYSSLLGSQLEEVALDAKYWVENLTKPVLFSTALGQLVIDAKPDVIIEVGPHSALEGPIKQILKGISQQTASEVKYVPSLVRNQHATETMLKLAGNLYTMGQPLDFSEVNQTKNMAQRPAVIGDFVPYPWSDHKYWYESRLAKQHRFKPFPRHDLLGTLEDAYSTAEPIWRNNLSTDDVPWLRDHRMQSLITFPLAGYLCMAVEAVSQKAQLQGMPRDQISGFRLRQIQATKALIMEDGAQYETVVSLRAYAEGTKSYSNEWDEFSISSWAPNRGWLEHCRGLVGVKKQATANPISALKRPDAVERRKQAETAQSSKISLEKFYAELEHLGAGYKSSFTLPPSGGLEAGKEHSSCRVSVPETSAVMPKGHAAPSILSTAFMDLFFQLTFPILGAGKGEMPSLYMPSAIKEVDIDASISNQPGDSVQVICHGSPDSHSSGPVDFYIDSWGSNNDEPVVSIAGFRMTPVRNDVTESGEPRRLCYGVQWQPLHPASSQPDSNGANGDSLDVNGNGCNGNSNGHDTNESKLQTSNGAHNGNGANGDASHDSHDETPIVILTMRDEANPLVDALSQRIDVHFDAKPQVYTLSPSSPLTSPTNARYISLIELDRPLLHEMDATIFESIQSLLLTCSSVLWVSAGAYHLAERPDNNIAQGLLRTVRSETTKVAASLDLDPNSTLGHAEQAKLITDAFEASLASPSTGGVPDFEFAEDEGQLVVPRYVEDEEMNLRISRETQDSAPYLQSFTQPGRRLQLTVGTYGALDSLYWTDEPEVPLTDDEIEIKIAATGMNFKDVVIAMGQVPSPYIGVECSGTVTRVGANANTITVGDRVCAMSLGAYGTYTRCPATSAVVIPHDMSFALAASIPVVYSTAYYAIVELARMEPGERILIHAASGGVGQAAIQLAQMIGAEIFATVGSAEKKQLLIDNYSIPEDHIFYSRNTDFGLAVRTATGGKGVDVVINSLAGDLLRESWDCLAPFGRFLEIGKRDIISNTRLEMAKFEQNCTFSSVDLTLVAAERPKIMHKVLTAVMDLLTRETITPIGPITVVPISEVESALRKLQSGKTSGKVIVDHLSEDQQVKATHPPPSTSLLKADATYVIIGGTGGIGRSLAKRLVSRGARHIVLLSRQGAVSAEVAELAEECQQLGASVHVKRCDAANKGDVHNLLADLAQTLPPVRGVIHAAMVLKDVLFEKMTFSEYDAVVRPKVRGAWNFHTALINEPLDFFVMLSSVAGIVGNRGQAGYAAANTYLDALAAYRRRHGLSAVSLDLAAIEDVGYLAENTAKRSQVMKNLAGSSMGEAELLALIEAAIEGKVQGNQCITGLDFSNPSSLPYYASDGKFSILREAALAKASGNEASGDAENLSVSQRLKRATSVQEAVDVVMEGLRGKLATILMLSTEDVAIQQATTSITALGLDSLTAIELRNWITKELEAHLQVLELLTSGLLQDLAVLVLKKTNLKWVGFGEQGGE